MLAVATLYPFSQSSNSLFWESNCGVPGVDILETNSSRDSCGGRFRFLQPSCWQHSMPNEIKELQMWSLCISTITYDLCDLSPRDSLWNLPWFCSRELQRVAHWGASTSWTLSKILPISPCGGPPPLCLLSSLSFINMPTGVSIQIQCDICFHFPLWVNVLLSLTTAGYGIIITALAHNRL